ncbi:hypothetical protein ACQZV8_08675 [Magnetococcales bacterium HHB-1]
MVSSTPIITNTWYKMTQPWRFTLLFMLLITGCSTIPDQKTRLLSLGEKARLDHYNQDQKTREKIRDWRVSGILELVPKTESPFKVRFKMLGREAHSAKLQIFGAFRQIARELYLDPDYIHMVEPDKKKVYRVKSHGEGLKQLSGIHVDPLQLMHMLLGKGGALEVRPGLKKEVFLSQDNETIKLNDQNLIQARSGITKEGKNYHVTYQWQPLDGEPRWMAKKIQIETDGQILRMRFGRWILNQGTQKDWPGPPEHFTLIHAKVD